MRNYLNEILVKQASFMKLLGTDVTLLTEQERHDSMKWMSVALADEAMEILRETSWKPWKKPKQLDHAKIKEEIIDALHFVLEMALLMNMSSEDIYDAYSKKMDENIRRQKEGY